MVRVLLAVSHSQLRAALHEWLADERAIVCGEAATSEELWNCLWRDQWDILFLDLCLPQQTKLQSVRTLHDLYPHIPILAASSVLGITPRQWERAGASGFISKAKLGSELIAAVQVLSQGGRYFKEGGAEMTT